MTSRDSMDDYTTFFVWGYRTETDNPPLRIWHRDVAEIRTYGDDAYLYWSRGSVAAIMARRYGVDLSGGEA